MCTISCFRCLFAFGTVYLSISFHYCMKCNFYQNCVQGYVGQFVHTIQMFDSDKAADIQKVKAALWALVSDTYVWMLCGNSKMPSSVGICNVGEGNNINAYLLNWHPSPPLNLRTIHRGKRWPAFLPSNQLDLSIVFPNV